MSNLIMIDRGALQMALNVLERAGKTEVVNEVRAACTPIHDDWRKHVNWFVRGMLHEYLELLSMEFSQEYFNTVLAQVFTYLNGDCELDARFSDIGCHISLEAAKRFGRSR